MENIKSNRNLSPNEIENPTRFVALSATFTALVFVATAIFNLAITATNGYFNFGESMVYLAALVGGPLVGLVAGAVGSSLADIISGYGFYAPGTFIIKGLEGYVAGYLFLKLRNLNAKQIKSVYLAFTGIFLSLTVALTTPSLWQFVGNLYSGKASLGKFPFDIGSYNFELGLTIYTPTFNTSNLQNFIVWNSNYSYIDITGLLLILLALILCLLTWYAYFYYGEKSKIIISCALAGLIIVLGYFMYETIVLAITPVQAFAEVPFNILQVFIGIIIALPTFTFLLKNGIIKENSLIE